MNTSWTIAVLVGLGAVLGASVALIANAGPHTASAVGTSDGFALGLLLGIPIGAAVRQHRQHRQNPQQ